MWHQVSLTTTEVSADYYSDLLSELGALSISLEDEGDQPIFEPKPGETPIWHNTRVIALFEAETDLAAIKAELDAPMVEHRYGSWRVEALEDQAWERAWLEHFRPMSFGQRLWILPTGFERPDEADAVCVQLDPGLAFGTGTHPTTALCLQWLDGQPLQGKSVIDFGCGSGILGIAALLLGAERCVAVDIDPQALTATADNAQKNGVAHCIQTCLPQGMPEGQYDIVLANILANPLIELAGKLADLVKPGGRIALSGILREQAEQVLLAYLPYFEMDAPVFQDDWCRLSGALAPGR